MFALLLLLLLSTSASALQPPECAPGFHGVHCTWSTEEILRLRSGPYVEICPGTQNATFLPWTFKHNWMHVPWLPEGNFTRFYSGEGDVPYEKLDDHMTWCEYPTRAEAEYAGRVARARMDFLQDMLGHRYAHPNESFVLDKWAHRHDPEVRHLVKLMHVFPSVREDVWNITKYAPFERLRKAREELREAQRALPCEARTRPSTEMPAREWANSQIMDAYTAGNTMVHAEWSPRHFLEPDDSPSTQQTQEAAAALDASQISEKVR